MLEKQEEQKVERLIRCMFEAELYAMENRENVQRPVAFSEVFEQRMQRLIRNQRRNAQVRTVVRYVLSAAAVLLILFCLTNPGYIAKAWDVLVRWHSTHLEIDMPDTGQAEALPEYEMTYVPEGFALTMKDCDELRGLILYENGEKEICMHYSVSGGNYNYDNERSEISVIEDEEGTEILLVKFGDGGYSMLWKSKEGITFSLDGDVDEKELFRIKDGIKAKK